MDEDVVAPDPTQGRRAFLKRMAAFAFAAPVISSFVLDGPAFAGTRDEHGKCPPNQHGQNQTQTLNPYPGQYGQNQTQTLNPYPGQYGQNQTQKVPCAPPNQYGQNQTKITKYGRHF
jgi:hypothetical protein